MLSHKCLRKSFHNARLCSAAVFTQALAWLGPSSSEILDLYYHLHDADSQAAMRSVAEDAEPEPAVEPVEVAENVDGDIEGTSRANGESEIEKRSEVPEEDELVSVLDEITERAGFEPAVRTSRTQPFQGCSLSHSDTSPTGWHRRHCPR